MGEINKKYDVSKDINDLKKNGVSQENINTAVNNYMQEHPISGGLTVEQEAKLNKVDNKVDKVEGKGLSTEDFTTEYKNKLEGLSNTGVSDEQISTAVNNYMQEHPVSSGATAEQVAQIQANKTAIGDANSGLTKEINDIKNTELQNLNTDIQTLETLVGDKNRLPSGDANIITSINRIDSKASGTNVDLSEYQKKSDSNLNTTDKNIVGAINEIKTSLSNLVIESGNLNIIDYTFGCTLKLNEIKPIYGNIIVNKTSIAGNEGDSDSFTVKLDSAPNVNQSVKIHCADAYVNVSSQDLIFTPTNYSTEQTITVDILENPSYEDWVADIKVMGNNVETKTITVNATNTTETPIEITSIQLDKTVLNLKDGETAILTPTIEPSNAGSGYSWKSSANNIATVDNGTVRGIAQGSAVITCYSTTNENIKAECNVSVTETAIESITLPEVATVNRNRSITLTPTIVPSGLTTYAWSIDNENASINNGVVTGVTAGTSIVTCYSTKNNSIKDTTTVTIEELPIESITLDSETVSVTQGKTVTLTPTITPSDATVGYSWSANNANVNVENGVVTGVTAGTSVVTCYSNADNSIKAECTITINEKQVVNIDNIAIKDESLIAVFDARDGSNEEQTTALPNRIDNEDFSFNLSDFPYTTSNGFTDNNTIKFDYNMVSGISGANKIDITLSDSIGNSQGYDNDTTHITHPNHTLMFAIKNIDIVYPENNTYPNIQFFLRASGSYGIGLSLRPTGLYCNKSYNDEGTLITDDSTGNYHVAMCWDKTNSVVKIYINGVFKIDCPFSATQGNGSFFKAVKFYNLVSGSSEALSAELSFFSVYNRVLTADEISQNYNAYMGV